MTQDPGAHRSTPLHSVETLSPQSLLRQLTSTRLCPGQHLGMDIGGANLKVCLISVAADGSWEVDTKSLPFAMWQKPEQLTATILNAVRSLSTLASAHFESCTITMTGEIADCFPSKQQGVRSIVDSCAEAMASWQLSPRFYAQVEAASPSPQTGSEPSFRLHDTATAQQNWLAVAASNWHAVANLIRQCLFASGQYPYAGCLLLDLGSTTLDLTHLSAAALPFASDWQRIQAGQLVYTGVGRSPMACQLPRFHTMDGLSLPLAQELFATARDTYLITGDVEPADDDRNTADGRPATVAMARQRIARMLCSDVSELPPSLIDQIADQAKSHQMSLVSQAIERQVGPQHPTRLALCCGEGEFLLQQVLQRDFPQIAAVSMSQQLPLEISAVAPAFAVAYLGCQRFSEN